MRTLALHIKKADGSILSVSSWLAWRVFAPLHMRRQCPACDGEGVQEWFIQGGPDKPDRWFGSQCTSCRGRGWLLP